MITRQLLLADADPYMRAMVKRSLAKRRLRIPGFRDSVCFDVETVTSDDEAIRRIALDPPDIVVLECRAFGLDGLKILEAIEELHPDTVAIVATLLPSIPAAVEATKLGAFAFAAKPLSETRLRELLSQATAAQLDYSVRPRRFSTAPLRNAVHGLAKLPAALAHLATTAISLY